MRAITVSINGEPRSITPNGAESLLHVLRDDSDLLGTKGACEEGECGSCSVLLEGDLVCSCLVMAADCDGLEVITIEGLSNPFNSIQEAMRDHGAVQCGFCTPGFVVAATHLMTHNPNPSVGEIREGLSGNLCRCTGYGAIVRSIADLAASLALNASD